MRKGLILFAFVLLFISFVSVEAQSRSFSSGYGSSSFTSSQLYRPSFQTYYGSAISTYWPILNDKDTCEARQDFLLQVSPGGCSPAVVRSDLLADQNVPVFCQIDGLQLNPLIDVKSIRNIGFSGKYPEGIAGVGFHPANVALRTNDVLLGNPVINNLGYVVVVLKQTKNISAQKDFINFTLTAKLEYNAGNAYGIGKAEYMLEPMSDAEWNVNKAKQSFFQGQYFVRLDDADSNYAYVSLYKGDVKIASTKVDMGKQSGDLFIPGYYCRAGVKVAYDGFTAKQDSARIEISDDRGVDAFDVYRGSYFLEGNCRVNDLTINASNAGVGIIDASCYGKRLTLSLQSMKGKTNVDEKISDSLVSEYLNKTLKYYEQVADDYPGEKKETDQQTYGEQGLIRAVDVAGQNEQFNTQIRLMQKFVQLYPNNVLANQYNKRMESMLNLDFSDSVKVIDVGSRTRTVSLVSFTKMMDVQSKAKVVIVIGGSQVTLRLGESTSVSSTKSVKVTNIDSYKATFDCIENGNVVRSRQINVGQVSNVCSGDANKESVRLLEIQNLDKVAKIRLIPSADNPTTVTNISVGIGIEKSALKLNPAKTELKIKNLNESIVRWEKISKNLGNVVTGLKTACFVTAGVLTIKNFLSGTGGEALARQQAMNGQGGWSERCSREVAVHAGGVQTLTECYNKYANDIEKDVQARTNAIKTANQHITEVESGVDADGKAIKTTGVLQSSVDVDKAKQAYAKKLNSLYNLGVPESDEAGLKYLTYSDLRELEYNYLLKGNSAVSQEKLIEDYNSVNNKVIAGKDLGSLAKQQAGLEADVFRNSAKIGALTKAQNPQTEIFSITDGKVNVDGKPKEISLDGINLPKDSNSVAFLDGSTMKNPKTGEMNPAKKYMVVGKLDNANGVLKADAVYEVVSQENGIITAVPASDSKGNAVNAEQFYGTYGLGEVRANTAKKYNNAMIAASQEVRFFGSGTYEGYPAVVPFDLKNGWYAYVRPTLGVGNQLANYDKSGAPRVFDICNVGSDGTIDLESTKDDCQTINVGINEGQPVLGMSAEESKVLVARAKSALVEAAGQRGNSVVKINGQKLRTGEKMLAAAGTQCQQFMRPEDCKLLFNLCDPVICPASRCNFGGKYQVDDVIQTGIVGGALLCLPNAREGIAVPVCLTGIQAGIDGYLSVMKSYRGCLQENLKSGQLVGICDQIHSLYLCDFFWRQMAPLANILIPKVVESVYTGSIAGTPRNGGEYLSVMSAWSNTKASVDYFTQSYAVNSLKAFQVRSMSEVGTQVCKSFISTKAPDAFKNLVAPDSPPQFFAQFESTPYTTVTIPPTSQYKVFYNIFAGKDMGVQYSIYLRNPPQSTEYSATPTIQVDSGFIGKGQTVDKTRDFTAPDGYKELCVMINDKLSCGFKQVTTDFGLNYLSNSYAVSQLNNTNIQSEKECIYGSADAKAILANTNPQSALEEAGLPNIHERGIVRICASTNPGASTNPERYQNVGKCDTNRGCWLDKQSVNNALIDQKAIKATGLANDTLASLSLAALNGGSKVATINDERYGKWYKKIDDDIKNLKNVNAIDMTKEVKKVVDEIDNYLINYLFYNVHKASFILLKAQAYDNALDIVKKGIKIDEGKKDTTTTTKTQTTQTSTNSENKVLSFNSQFVLNDKQQEVLLNGKPTGVFMSNSGATYNGDNLGRFKVSGENLIINLSSGNDAIDALSADNPDLKNLLDGAVVKKGRDEIDTSNSAYQKKSLTSESYTTQSTTASITGGATSELLEFVPKFQRVSCEVTKEIKWDYYDKGKDLKTYNVSLCMDSYSLMTYNEKFGQIDWKTCYAPKPSGIVERIEYRPYWVFSQTEYDDNYISDLAQQLKELAVRDFPNDEYGQKSFIMNFVHKVAIYKNDTECYNCADRATYPYEVLYSGKGDCEDASILLSKLFNLYGYNNLFLEWGSRPGAVIKTGHVNNAITCDSCKIEEDIKEDFVNIKTGVESTKILNSMKVSRNGKSYYVVDATFSEDEDEIMPGWLFWKRGVPSMTGVDDAPKIVTQKNEAYIVMKNYVGSYAKLLKGLYVFNVKLANYGNAPANNLKYKIYFAQDLTKISKDDIRQQGPVGEDLLVNETEIVNRLDVDKDITINYNSEGQFDTRGRSGMFLMYIDYDGLEHPILYAMEKV